MRLRFAAVALLFLAGCASPPAMPPLPERVRALLPADVLLLGEQHDAEAHQRIGRETVEWLAAEGRLAALALEMAEQGRSTRGLASNADEATVQAALAWDDKGWPWQRYGPAVMAAVRAGVLVLGANLPRMQMRPSMQDVALDSLLDPATLSLQRDAVREGHCALLPESQIGPMTRIQIARDATMARTLQSARVPGKTVLLLAGGGHVLRDRGVPRHLPDDVSARVLLLRAGAASQEASGLATADTTPKAAADLVQETPALPPVDYCAALRRYRSFSARLRSARPAAGTALTTAPSDRLRHRRRCGKRPAPARAWRL